MTQTVVNFLRAPDPKLPVATRGIYITENSLKRTRWQGAIIVPYIDDFLLFATSEEEALTLR
jgi:hypothetical protein